MLKLQRGLGFDSSIHRRFSQEDLHSCCHHRLCLRLHCGHHGTSSTIFASQSSPYIVGQGSPLTWVIPLGPVRQRPLHPGGLYLGWGQGPTPITAFGDRMDSSPPPVVEPVSMTIGPQGPYQVSYLIPSWVVRVVLDYYYLLSWFNTNYSAYCSQADRRHCKVSSSGLELSFEKGSALFEHAHHTICLPHTAPKECWSSSMGFHIEILSRVLHYLRSKKWDTRVAAAHAIGAIVLNVKHISLSELLNSLRTKLGEAGLSGNVDEVVASGNLQSKLQANAPFRSFEMNKVLEFGALLASGGQEYDVLNDNSKNPRDRVARQKKNLRRGLDMCEQFMDVNEMIGDEDLIEQKPNVHANGIGNRLYAIYSPHHIQQYVSRMVPRVNPRRPSARELNLLKRKAKISSKDQAKGNGEGADVEMSSCHAPTSTRTLSDSLDSNKANIGNEDDIIEPDVDGRWPFHNFVEQLTLDMFDPGKVHVLVPYAYYFIFESE
ncbi:hypothetical protein DY000_02032732 [Brassica cretica]|uniref:Uncharacterized protein n=1 Tax=Brassica cretica TaxID=69181 RepID=A0ABQ7DW08_BRACR|nr:hypothetical protein DY000_02032732 [Brassica cretica]